MSAVGDMQTDLGAARNLSAATLQLCGVRDVGREHRFGVGWTWNTYTLEGIKAERWKSFSSTQPEGVTGWAKYRWSPEKPPGNASYFDPDYKLRTAIKEASGVLFLVGGEIAAMSMFEAGYRNSTCFFGDNAIPDSLYEDLKRLGVYSLMMIPDRDNSGLKCAQDVRDLLKHDLDFEFSVYALPYELTDKHGKDVNDLWLQIGDVPKFEKAIADLVPWRLPEPPNIIQFPTLDSGNKELPPRFIEAILKDVQSRATPNKPFKYDSDGWSNNFRCPFHDDQMASAGFNKESMSFKCFACGPKSAKQYGEGVNIYLKDYFDSPIPIVKVETIAPPTPAAVVAKSATTEKRQLRPKLPISAQLTPEQEREAERGRDWLNDYLDWTKKSCPLAPEIFHEAMALWLLATVATRRMKAVIGGREVYPNLYVLIIAKTSLYRKSTAMNEAKKVLKISGLESLLLPTDVTPEALFDELGGVPPINYDKLSDEDRKDWLQGRAVAAQRSFIKDECSSIFANLKKDYNAGLTELLLEGYQGDGGKLRKLLKSKGLISVKDMCLSFLGATTPVMYAKYITNEENENGFVARFGIITPEGLPIYTTVDEVIPVPKTLTDALRHLFLDVLPWHNDERPVASSVLKDEVLTPPTLTVTIAPEAFKQIAAYDKALNYDMLVKEGVPEAKIAAYTRLATMHVKVSMLLAAMDGQPKSVRIEGRHAYAAQIIVERWRESLHRLDTDLARSIVSEGDKIMDYLKTVGEHGATIREILRDCSVKQRYQLDSILKTLHEDGSIESFEHKPNGAGRPSIRFRIPIGNGN